VRLGHSLPAGTVWRSRITGWRENDDFFDEPELGDLVFEKPETLYRGFRVVGFEETRNPDVWVILLERMRWGDWEDEVAKGEHRVWSFVRNRR
jgi:hypothetical protein